MEQSLFRRHCAYNETEQAGEYIESSFGTRGIGYSGSLVDTMGYLAGVCLTDS
jgi:hypothetical protein